MSLWLRIKGWLLVAWAVGVITALPGFLSSPHWYMPFIWFFSIIALAIVSFRHINQLTE